MSNIKQVTKFRAVVHSTSIFGSSFLQWRYMSAAANIFSPTYTVRTASGFFGWLFFGLGWFVFLVIE